MPENKLSCGKIFCPFASEGSEKGTCVIEGTLAHASGEMAEQYKLAILEGIRNGTIKCKKYPINPSDKIQ